MATVIVAMLHIIVNTEASVAEGGNNIEPYKNIKAHRHDGLYFYKFFSI
jgi:hypothetical protein